MQSIIVELCDKVTDAGMLALITGCNQLYCTVLYCTVLHFTINICLRWIYNYCFIIFQIRLSSLFTLNLKI